MKKLIIVCIIATAALSCKSLPQRQSQNLFNGKDLSGWHVDVPKMDNDPNLKSPFIVRNGLLVSLGTPRGHLITDEVYQDYRLEVQYRFAGKPGNCGILAHASTPRALYKMFPKSIEGRRYLRARYGQTARAEGGVGYHRRQETPDSQSDRRLRKIRRPVEHDVHRMPQR